MKTVKSLALKVAAILMLGFVATKLWTLQGEVREEGTNKPIAGAFVVATWMGYGQAPVQGSTRCYHIEFATTDEAGRFRVSEWSGNINPLLVDRVRSMDVYAPGYNKSAKSSSDEGRFFMTRRTGTKEEQFEQVALPSTYNCHVASDRRQLPMYKALHSELTALATTEKQKTTALDALWSFEILELGEPQAGRNHGARLEQFYRDKKAAK